MSQQSDPIRDLMGLRDRMNQRFEDATERRAQTSSSADPRDAIDHAEWVPAADVYEEGEHYIVAVDLPGVDRSAMAIDIEQNRLTIQGNRVASTQTEHRRERGRGKFSRSFSLPPSIDHDRIEAEYQDGVLYVRLGKLVEQKPQRVQIAVS